MVDSATTWWASRSDERVTWSRHDIFLRQNHSALHSFLVRLPPNSSMRLHLRSMKVNRSIPYRIYRDCLADLEDFNNKRCWPLRLWSTRFLPSSEYYIVISEWWQLLPVFETSACRKICGLDYKGNRNWRISREPITLFKACWSSEALKACLRKRVASLPW